MAPSSNIPLTPAQAASRYPRPPHLNLPPHVGTPPPWSARGTNPGDTEAQLSSFHGGGFPQDTSPQANRFNSDTSDPNGPDADTKELHPVSRIARRVHGWSWQAFPIGMGTGAVYVTLSGLKYHNHTLSIIETIFYFMNIAVFLLNSTTLLLQAIIYPRQAKRLATDPVRGIFVPLIVLSFATIIIGTINYEVPKVVSPGFIYGLFWVYVTFALITCFPMLMIWFNKPHDLAHFTPAYMFLIFPMMLTGVVAFNVLKVMDPSHRNSLTVLLVGYFFQGIGFFMTFFYLAIYILRIMTTGFLEGHQANGAFVACGPPGFTALALIHLGESARKILTVQKLVSPLAGEIWYSGSVLCALLLFGLAIFFFVFGVIPYWFKLHKHLHEILGCWALTFPNVGWIACLRALGDIFNIQGFYVVHAVMSVIMVIVWAILLVFTLVAFWKGKIFYSEEEAVRKEWEPEADVKSAVPSDVEQGHGQH